MQNNCGLTALSKMISVDTVSMFSLIHLAKDNGLTLYFCQVDPLQIYTVVRPAILHQKNHFVFVADGEVVPEGEYTGFVLTPRPTTEPLPFTLAKKVRGQGTSASSAVSSAGKAASSAGRAISSAASNVVRGVTAAVRPLYTAASTAAGNIGRSVQSTASNIGNLFSGPSAMASSSPSVRATATSPSSFGSSPSPSFGSNTAVSGGGGYRAPAALNIPQMAGNLASGGVSALGSAFNAGVSGLAHMGQNVMNTIGSTFKSNPTSGGVESAPSAGGSLSATGMAGGGYQAPGKAQSTWAPPGTTPGSSVSWAGNNNSQSQYDPYAYSKETNARNDAMQGQSDQLWGNVLGNSRQSPISVTRGAGGGGGMDMSSLNSMGAPPVYENDSAANYSKAAQLLGGANYNALPSATRDQLNKYMGMSINDMANSFVQQDDKGMRLLEEKHQQEKNALMTQYANYGQDPYTSSDAANQLAKIDRSYDQAKAEYQQQVQNAAMDKAIKFKQETLAQSMQQGQFDYQSAMELATYMGRDNELKYAMQSKNYEQMQNVMAELLSQKAAMGGR